MAEPAAARLLTSPLGVINIGLAQFAADLSRCGAAVTHVDWLPPAGAVAGLGDLLAGLFDDQRIETANQEASRRLLAAEPVLVDVVPAQQAIPALGADKTVLHAGPPISWERMCRPLKGAICGAIVLEGWAA